MTTGSRSPVIGARSGRGGTRLDPARVGPLAVLLVVATATATLAGCGTKAPSTGIARVDHRTVVAFKPCEHAEDAGIGRIDLYGSDDPDNPIWTAIHVDGQPTSLELPVAGRYPGYEITDRRPGNHLDRIQTYSFEAVAVDGTAWGGPSFRVSDLRPGHVRVAGQDLKFAEWIGAPASCPNVSFLGALLTGLVVAAVAGGALLGARGLRNLSRRGRRAPSPDA